MDSPRIHFPTLSKLAKERLIFVKIQNIPHLKFLHVSIKSFDKLNIFTVSTTSNFRAQIKSEIAWEREQLFYGEVKFKKYAHTYLLGSWPFMIRKAMDTYHREARSYLKTSLLPILFTSCWVGQA